MIYSNALHNSFVYDDYFDLNEARQFRSPGSIPLLFYSDVGKLYRPFKFFLYALDLWIWNLGPFGCHLTNILLHLACGILVYGLLLEHTGKKILGFWAALFFLAHPVRTESGLGLSFYSLFSCMDSDLPSPLSHCAERSSSLLFRCMVFHKPCACAEFHSHQCVSG